MEKNAKVTLAILIVLLAFVPVVVDRWSYESSYSHLQPENDADLHLLYTREVDATTTVIKVIDGDTFDTSSKDKVRLADIDAPENGESGYYEAKSALESLIENKIVYLDIDDKYRIDQYRRLVCVVYVRHNSTHLMNVNKALLASGHARISNYDNEFSPLTWTLYYESLETSEDQNKDNNQPSDDDQPSDNPPANPPQTKKFVGSINSVVYHYPSCYWAKKITSYNQIWFSSSKDARAHGYRPCKVCKPPDSDQPSDNPPANPPQTKKYVGSVNSNIYHHSSCYWAKKIKSSNRISFSNSKDARAHGYRPCKVCKPP